MAFGWAGGAQGAQQSLEEIVAQRILVAKLREEVERRERDQSLREQETAERSAQSAWTRNRTDRLDQEQADTAKLQQRGRANMAGVMAMGVDPQTARKEIAFSSLQSGADIPSGVMEAMTPPKVTRHAVTTNVGGKPVRKLVTEDELAGGIEEYREPKAGPAAPKTPLWVKQADGTVVDINKVAPPGSRPIDAVADRQQAATEDGNKRAVEAMRAFGDDMLSVIDTLIDEQGNLKPEVAGVIGGVGGARPEWAYLTEGSQGALANIDRLQSMLNIDTLRDMKSQSRTGATGFGALSERELNVVESSASKLRRRRQGDTDYAAELKRLRDTIRAGRAASQGTGQTVVGDDLDTLIERLRKPKG